MLGETSAPLMCGIMIVLIFLQRNTLICRRDCHSSFHRSLSENYKRLQDVSAVWYCKYSSNIDLGIMIRGPVEVGLVWISMCSLD